MEAKAQIFLSYARQDEKEVEDLYQKLSDAGFKPWMDTKDILPGERWKSSIRKAVRRSDFFLACLSANSVTKRGFLQKEINLALNIWQEKLEDDIYLIPARLEDCEVPRRLRKFQWVNLFEADGWIRLVKAIQKGMRRLEEEIKPIFQESMLSESYSAHEKPSPGKEMTIPGEGPEQIRSEKPAMSGWRLPTAWGQWLAEWVRSEKPTLSEESRMFNTSEGSHKQLLLFLVVPLFNILVVVVLVFVLYIILFLIYPVPLLPCKSPTAVVCSLAIFLLLSLHLLWYCVGPGIRESRENGGIPTWLLFLFEVLHPHQNSLVLVIFLVGMMILGVSIFFLSPLPSEWTPTVKKLSVQCIKRDGEPTMSFKASDVVEIMAREQVRVEAEIEGQADAVCKWSAAKGTVQPQRGCSILYDAPYETNDILTILAQSPCKTQEAYASLHIKVVPSNQ